MSSLQEVFVVPPPGGRTLPKKKFGATKNEANEKKIE
jgi:hypothetical protein